VKEREKEREMRWNRKEEKEKMKEDKPNNKVDVLMKEEPEEQEE